jgi:GNAT superfamily N-acetyltransferase
MREGQNIEIIPMTSEHAAQVARLHIEGIKEGFIGSLGSKFVYYLYQAIVESDKAFGFVAVKGDKVLGFVSCAENTGTVYMMMLKRNFFRLFWAYLPKILHLKNIKKVAETLLYPVRSRNVLPPAELLSVVVAKEARGLGLGGKLVEASKEEFRRRGVTVFKTTVDELFPANDFYKHIGFKHVGKCYHHGDMHNTYVLEIKKQKSADLLTTET